MGDSLTRLTAALSDRYRIERELGAGGMATVYLAADLKHDRKVAIKVLRPELAAVIGAERFLAEIKTTANLQHPHILPLHDSGEVDGTVFYVMPFVDGETLRDRLDRERQLPIDDAVRITREVASALDYAHRKGIIHRDIKPENILLHEGQALVADFGIALAAATTGSSRMTETGMSLGTPHYMSPEQAMGERTLDARADVYALGCVLYEMLVGEPPFTGPTAQAIVARVLSGSPEAPSVRRSTVPANVNAAVLTALQKLPADRFPSAAAMSEALQDRGYATTGARVVQGARATGRWNRVAIAATAIAAVAVMLAAWAFLSRPSAGEKRVLRAVVALPDSLTFLTYRSGYLALSPDGSQLVFSGLKPEGGPSLWLRATDQLQAVAIASTKNAGYSRFAPDNHHVGYVDLVTGALKVVELGGGTPRTIADTGVGRSPIAFAPDGSVVAQSHGVLTRFPAAGGPPVAISTLDNQAVEAYHFAPDVLPNGQGVIFTVAYQPPVNMSRYSIAVADLKTGRHRVLVPGVAAHYVAGYLLVVHANGALTAAPFDQGDQRLTGPEIPVAADVRVDAFGTVSLTSTTDGALVAYTSGIGRASEASLVWLTRDGKVTQVDSTWRANFDAISLSPDGRQIAASLGENGTDEVWIKQVGGGQTKLTFGAVRQYRPRWLPDGKSVSFLTEEKAPYGLVTKRADGIGETGPLAVLDRNLADGFVSPDGKWIILRTSSATAGQGDILARRIDDTAVVPLVAAKDVSEREPALSPDGKWLAYASNENNGRYDVYVRPFPNVNDGKWLVSLNGGTDPAWSHSGRELFYITSANELMAATIAVQPNFSVRERTKLFTMPADIRTSASATRFEVAPGDQRFLMVKNAADTSRRATGDRLILMTNIVDDLKRKAGIKK
jgi:eukaryotic-like serine/threonine-protein kinase